MNGQITQLLIIAINLTMAHQHEISQQNDYAPYNSKQQELLTRGRMCEGSVVEDAVECISRRKSRCEQMYRFPNTGGLHRTPGDAPLDFSGSILRYA